MTKRNAELEAKALIARKQFEKTGVAPNKEEIERLSNVDQNEGLKN